MESHRSRSGGSVPHRIEPRSSGEGILEREERRGPRSGGCAPGRHGPRDGRPGTRRGGDRRATRWSAARRR